VKASLTPEQARLLVMHLERQWLPSASYQLMLEAIEALRKIASTQETQ